VDGGHPRQRHRSDEHRSYADARRVVDEMVAQDRLSLESVTFLRAGRCRTSFVIVDEAQNLEVPTLKTLLTRVAEGTKIVFTGDLAQNRHALRVGP